MTSTSKLSGNVLVSLPMWGLLRLSDGASYPEFGVRPFLAELQMRIMQLAREGSPPPRLRLPQAELSRKSNQIARGRIRRFESDMPSQAVRSLWRCEEICPTFIDDASRTGNIVLRLRDFMRAHGECLGC
jgi:hypothetical protein